MPPVGKNSQRGGLAAGSATMGLRSGAVGNDDDGRGEDLATTSLPPELWAGVLEYLPFDAVLSCGATSRSMLDAMPLLRTLRIDASSQMNLSVASRFPDVREIHINSLLSLTVHDEGTHDEFRVVDVTATSRNRVVPYLSRFSKLERVIIGGKTDAGEDIEGFTPVAEHFWEGDEAYPNEGGREAMLAFIDIISDGFCCRALPPNLEVSGLCCPDSANRNTLNCETCMSACKTWPLDEVVQFECMRSSIDSARSGRLYGLDVCLQRAQIESVIESRPGGHDLLRSDQRLLYQLGRGRLYKIVPDASDGGGAFCIVKYTPEHLDEIKRVIKYADVDIKKLPAKKLLGAVMRSFTKHIDDRIPAKYSRYLSETSFTYLSDKIGLVLDREELCSDAADLLGHARQIVSVIARCAATTRDEEYEDIFIDCLKLFRRFSELDDSLVHKIEDVVPTLVKCLRLNDDFAEDAVVSLKNILAKGTENHRKMVIEAGVIRDLCQMLNASKQTVVKAAILILADISTGTNEDIEAVNAQVTVSPLVDLLESEDAVCVEGSLRVMAALKKGQIRDAVDMGLMPCLVQVILSTETTSCALADCSMLLRNILEIDVSTWFCRRPIHHVAESSFVCRLIELMKTDDDDSMRTNLAHVTVHIAAQTSNRVRKSLAQEDGFLPTLVGLVHFPDVRVAEKAVAALGNIAEESSEHRKLVLEAGIARPLMQLLKSSTHSLRKYWSSSTLKVATKTFEVCCLEKSFGFDYTKAGLMILPELLANSEEEIVANSCWALHHLLAGLSESQLSEVIDMGFARHLIKLLSKEVPTACVAALKSICLITSAGEKCIQSIIEHNGIACIKQALLSSNNSIQSLACSATSNIMAGTNDQIQAVLDAEVVPSLIQLLTSKRNKRQRHIIVESMKRVTTGGTADQIKYLVSQEYIHHLCGVLEADYETANVALCALRNIFTVGRKDGPARLTTTRSISIQMIESKLEELIAETVKLESQSKRVDLLKKKRAWLEADAQGEHTKSLKSTLDLLKGQHNQELKQVQEFGEAFANDSIRSDSPLHRAYIALDKKRRETVSFLSSQMICTRAELHKASEKLTSLLDEAEKIAPKEEWHARLDEDDLPPDIKSANHELKESISILDSLNATRVSDQRRADIEAMRSELRKLFKGKNSPATAKKKRVASGIQAQSSKKQKGA